MAFSETFQTSTVFLKICIVLVPVGCLLHLIGLSSDYWTYGEVDLRKSIDTAIKQFGSGIRLDVFSGLANKIATKFEIHNGLWKTCTNDVCRDFKEPPGKNTKVG